MVKIDLKGIAKVSAQGGDYYYAWRGGPRLRGALPFQRRDLDIENEHRENGFSNRPGSLPSPSECVA
jgi:hypothetical protein